MLPLFERTAVEYTVTRLKDLDLKQYTPILAEIIRRRNLTKLRQVDSLRDIEELLQILKECNEAIFLREVYCRLLDLERSNDCLVNQDDLACCLLEALPDAPYLIDLFLQSQTWESHKESLQPRFDRIAESLLQALILGANTLQNFIRSTCRVLLREIRLMSVQSLANVAELAALSVRDAETALDLLLEVIEPEASRLLVGRSEATRLCVRSLIGVALDHVDEAAQSRKSAGESLRLSHDGESDGFVVVQATIRLDSPLTKLLKTGDHVRLVASSPPQNAPLARLFAMDAVVLRADLGSANFRCIHRPPPYLKECSWKLYHCGSFVTAKTMFDALKTFYTEKFLSCRLFSALVGLEGGSGGDHVNSALPYTEHEGLNESQNRALEAAMRNSLAFLWGPPGTGKTHTIVAILTQLLNTLPQARVLVAAPTHNAVDNILQKFISEDGVAMTGVKPLRVSTSVSLG